MRACTTSRCATAGPVYAHRTEGNGRSVFFLADLDLTSKHHDVHKQLLAFDLGHAILVPPNEPFPVDDSRRTSRCGRAAVRGVMCAGSGYDAVGEGGGTLNGGDSCLHSADHRGRRL